MLIHKTFGITIKPNLLMTQAKSGVLLQVLQKSYELQQSGNELNNLWK